jgi:hypothetical protein
MSERKNPIIARAGAVLLSPITVVEAPLPAERARPAVEALPFDPSPWPKPAPLPPDARRAKTACTQTGEFTGSLHLPPADREARCVPLLLERRDKLAALCAEARKRFLQTDEAASRWRKLAAGVPGVAAAVEASGKTVEKALAAYSRAERSGDGEALVAANEKLEQARRALESRKDLLAQLQMDTAAAAVHAQAGLEQAILAARREHADELRAEWARRNQEWADANVEFAAQIAALETMVQRDLAHGTKAAVEAFTHLE